MSKRKGPRKGPRKAPTSAPPSGERACVVDRHCLEDLQWWTAHEARVATKALTLIEHVLRDSFSGPGKPEPLKGLLPNSWSRRITGEHRLVYVVFDDRVVFVQARYHY